MKYDQLRRISKLYTRWDAHECNGQIQRDDVTGLPYWHYEGRWIGKTWHRPKPYRIPDREKGADRRLAKIMESHPDFTSYRQCDPRGCSLYLISKAQLGDLPANSYYSSFGIAIFDWSLK